ncbi:MAG: flagellar export protein FliJ [Bacillota bacterium]
MRKFEFSLEKVLDFRANKEEDLKIQLASVQAKRQAEEHALEQYRQELAQQMKEAPTGNIDLGQWWHRWAYLERLEDVEEHQQTRVVEAQRVEKDCQQQVVNAMQDRKVLEELKAREVSAHIEATARQEQAAMDDLAITAFVHKQRNHHE